MEVSVSDEQKCGRISTQCARMARQHVARLRPAITWRKHVRTDWRKGAANGALRVVSQNLRPGAQRTTVS